MDTNKYQKYYITVNGIPNGCTLSISGGIITESKVADETGVITIDISPLLETNWIILPTPATYKDALRISPDGMLVQHKDIDSNWHPMFPPDADNNYYVQCYRAGLSHSNKEVHELAAEQWVELNGYWRISTDGIKVQRRDWCDDSDPWVDTTEAPELVKLYRTGLDHGREVAQAERQEEWDSKCREITALRAVLASINILMQERGFHPMGGPNYALLFGHVQTYIGRLETVKAEHEALREQVRALVEAVEEARTWKHEYRSDTGPLEWPTAESWDEIQRAAKRVEERKQL